MQTRADAERFAGTLPAEPYYAGRWGGDEDGAGTFDVIDPVTERRLATVTQAGPADVDGAVRSGIR